MLGRGPHPRGLAAKPFMSEAPPPVSRPSAASLARRVLAAFVLAFLAARLLVLLIMSRRLPDLYLHLGGTHVHHLNYGIFLLVSVGGYLLFQRPAGRPLAASAYLYGVGLALTFDEFGMWLHLGGGYWQRASFDAVVVVAAVLGLIAAAPRLAAFRARHWTYTGVLLLALAAFVALFAESLRAAETRWGPRVRALESQGPS